MKLNPAQKKAVNTIEGPVMVIAGPGTGKTQIIAERIAKILKLTDTPPDAILALTFTESGAKAMRERLNSVIGETAYYVNIYTFHSFCSSVMPPPFSLIPNPSRASALWAIKCRLIFFAQQFMSCARITASFARKRWETGASPFYIFFF